ncbi:MAG: NADAR family protein [Pseudobdellovibrionaceae bacterium]
MKTIFDPRSVKVGIMKKMAFLTIFFIVSIWSCAHSQSISGHQYPQEWWQFIDPKTAPAWEILPQSVSAKENKVILSKRNELGILSNFADTPFLFRGQRYQSVEGLWQSMKYPEGNSDPRIQPGILWPFSRSEVMLQAGFIAKDSGKIANENMKKLGIKWISFEGEKFDYNSTDVGKQKHYELIFAAMSEKMNQNEQVKTILLKTQNLILLADHDQGPNAAPAYLYANIWMKIRDQLQQNQ